MVMEAEKSHELPSTSWEHKKADSAIQSESKGPKAMGTDI